MCRRQGVPGPARAQAGTFLGEAEVQDDSTVRRDHHVARLQVAVDEALSVNRSKTRAGFARDLAKLISGVATLRLAATDVRVQRLPGDVLHHQDRTPRAGGEIVNSTDVWVTHRACEEKLLTQGLVVTGHARFFAHHLQRDRLLGRAVIGEKHLTHSTLS